jgi:hypothetical protein
MHLSSNDIPAWFWLQHVFLYCILLVKALILSSLDLLPCSVASILMSLNYDLSGSEVLGFLFVSLVSSLCT